MSPHVNDWLSLVLRWAHVISAITWIGHALFFNWLDASLDRREAADGDEVEGDLWMVHSGGFYHVLKKHTVAESILSRMHWFKWEAAATWLTGVMLLGVVYYHGGAALMIDKSVADLSQVEAIGVGFGSLIVGWVIYDLLWLSPLGSSSQAGAAVSFALLVALAYGLTQVLSGRAAYLHVGAVMGTCMVANVWMRIIPAQRELVAAVRAGKRPDQTLAMRAKTRSVHNNYMTYPLIFIMISNHYYQTFGAELNWLILMLLFVAGAGVRRIMNLRGGFSVPVAVAALAAAGTAIYLTAPETRSASRPAATRTTAKTGPPPAGARPVDPATAGAIEGVVTLDGPAPAPKTLALAAECAQQHDGPVADDSVVVSDGKLANAFVWIERGLDGWIVPDAPDTVVEIDQQGCIYRPRVLGVRPGQGVAILNSDPLLHNVHSVSEDNGGFNQAMPTRGTKLDKRFDEPEIMVTLKCDVHPWMRAYIGVVDHPWFAVTGADGSFAIEGVPPGSYTLGVWHEVFGRSTAEVTVPERGRARADLALTP